MNYMLNIKPKSNFYIYKCSQIPNTYNRYANQFGLLSHISEAASRAGLTISCALGNKTQGPPHPCHKATNEKSLSSTAYCLYFYSIRLLHGSVEMYAFTIASA